MSKVLKELLSQCEYALGEAKINTMLLKEKSTDDEEFQLNLEVDYNLFEHLQKEIRSKLFESRRHKNKNRGK